MTFPVVVVSTASTTTTSTTSGTRLRRSPLAVPGTGAVPESLD
jgi:hypothetical protein